MSVGTPTVNPQSTSNPAPKTTKPRRGSSVTLVRITCRNGKVTVEFAKPSRKVLKWVAAVLFPTAVIVGADRADMVTQIAKWIVERAESGEPSPSKQLVLLRR